MNRILLNLLGLTATAAAAIAFYPASATAATRTWDDGLNANNTFPGMIFVTAGTLAVDSPQPRRGLPKPKTPRSLSKQFVFPVEGSSGWHYYVESATNVGQAAAAPSWIARTNFPGPGHVVNTVWPIDKAQEFFRWLKYPVESGGWAKTVGSTSTDQGAAVATDAAGNTHFTGNFNGNNMFLTKHSPSGATLWTLDFSGTVFPHGIAVDGGGNVFVTGEYLGTAILGGGALPGGISSYSMFVAKYNASGVHLWSKGYQGSFQGSNIGRGIALDPDGNPVVAGICSQLDFGDGTVLVAPATGCAFMATLDRATGTRLYSDQFGGEQSVSGATAIAISPSGETFVTGYFHGLIDFGRKGRKGSKAESAVSYSGFVAKFNRSGALVWSEKFDPFSNSTVGLGGRGVAVTPAGDVLVAAAAPTASQQSPDIHMMRFSANGVLVWSKLITTSFNTSGGAWSVVSDTEGNGIYGGRVYGDADFGGITAGAGGFIARYNRIGTLLNLTTFPGNNTVNCVETKAACGTFSGATDFGFGQVQSISGTQDAYLVKLAP